MSDKPTASAENQALKWACWFAWCCGFAALGFVLSSYSALPDELPLGRSNKLISTSLWLVLRAPTANLLLVLSLQCLAQAAKRDRQAELVPAFALYALGIKAVIDGFTLGTGQPFSSSAFFVLFAGGALAAYCMREYRAQRRSPWTFTASEKVVLGFSFAAHFLVRASGSPWFSAG